MDILGQLKAQSFEQLDVEGQGGQPLVTANHVGGAHQMIVHRMSKVIGGDAVGLQQNMIHIVFRNGQLALDQVVKFELILNRAHGLEPQDPGIAGV